MPYILINTSYFYDINSTILSNSTYHGCAIHVSSNFKMQMDVNNSNFDSCFLNNMIANNLGGTALYFSEPYDSIVSINNSNCVKNLAM